MNIYKVDFTTWSQANNRYVVVIANSCKEVIQELVGHKVNRESQIHTIELIASENSLGRSDECCKLIVAEGTEIK